MNSMVGTCDNTFPFRLMHLIVAQLTIPALLRNLKGEQVMNKGCMFLLVRWSSKSLFVGVLIHSHVLPGVGSQHLLHLLLPYFDLL
jgi:hypothetical protein